MQSTASQAAPLRAAADTDIVLTNVITDIELTIWLDVANHTDPDIARTIEQLRNSNRRFPDIHRTIAFVDGSPVGIASCGHNRLRTDGTHFGRVSVLDDFHGRGVRTRLLEHVREHTDARGGLTLEVSTCASQTSNADFWNMRGFTEQSREMYVEIDPTAHDIPPIPYIPGLRIATVAEDRTLLDSMYLVGSQTWHDIPNERRDAVVPYEQWIDGITTDGSTNFDACFVALLNGAPVGSAEICLPPATPHLIWHGFTGVLREHRGLGIARALKISALHWARANGHHRLRTGNNIDNSPMRHINAQLGYRPHSIELTLRGDVRLIGTPRQP